MEKTLVLIKPDAVEGNHIGEILAIYEKNGLEIKEMKMLTATEDLAKAHYAEHVEKPFFPEILAYITRTPLVAFILEGENAVAKVRELNGSTDPKEAAEGTVRNLFAISKAENSVHASDSVESATREIAIWF